MLNSDDLRFFGMLSSAPSFAAAARLLDVTPPAITQRLAALERRLGVRLVHRGRRGIALTDEGVLLAEQGAALVDELDQIAEQLAQRRSIVRGCLRVSAPAGFGRKHVAPVLAELSAEHPELTVSLELADDPVRQRIDAWDVIIHIGSTPTNNLQRIQLAPNRRLLCASPAYLTKAGALKSPTDLHKHTLLALQENSETGTLLRFHKRGAETTTVRLKAPSMICNDGEVVRRWALAGHGVIVRSEWSVRQDIVDGKLVPLLSAWSLDDAPILALLGPRTGRTARARTFVEHMRRYLTA
jgi:DNA-binding transcriptional LysR family regulator